MFSIHDCPTLQSLHFLGLKTSEVARLWCFCCDCHDGSRANAICPCFTRCHLAGIWWHANLHRTLASQLSAGQLRRSPGCWDECQIGGRYVYEFKILIFFQCLRMLLMERQEKWKGGGGDESVPRLQLFKITLKFCKRCLFTAHLLPAVCSLGLEVWMGFLGVLGRALPRVPSLTGKHRPDHHTVLNRMATFSSPPHSCSSGELWGAGGTLTCCLTGNYRQLTWC